MGILYEVESKLYKSIGDYEWEFFNIEHECREKSYERIQRAVDRIREKQEVHVPWWKYVVGTLLGLGFTFGCMALAIGVALWLNP